MSERNKVSVRLVEEVLNGGRMDVIDALYAPALAAEAKAWIAPFRASFPDVHMEVVELIAEARLSDASLAPGRTWGTG